MSLIAATAYTRRQHLEEHAITHCWIYPRSPKMNAQAERFKRAIQALNLGLAWPAPVAALGCRSAAIMTASGKASLNLGVWGLIWR